MAARSSETNMKSLKWPAWRAASCRLSENPRTFRFSSLSIPDRLVVHPFQDRGDEDGGRGTAPLSRQTGESVEVRTLRGGQFAARRAEAEIARLEPALDVAGLLDRSCRSHMDPFVTELSVSSDEPDVAVFARSVHVSG